MNFIMSVFKKFLVICHCSNEKFLYLFFSEGHPGDFQFMIIMNKAEMNIIEQECDVEIHSTNSFLGYLPWDITSVCRYDWSVFLFLCCIFGSLGIMVTVAS